METLHLPADCENFVLSFQQPGMGHDTCVQAYDKDDAVKLYAQSAVALAYRGPQYCADMAAALVGERREEAVVLDVAAGTGLVGEELHKRGFKHIHAHDGALNMIETCKQKGIYSNFIHCLIGEGKQIPTADDTYDVLAMSGGTCENHLPPSAQQEFVRVIKPGGFFVNAYRSTMPTIEYGRLWEAEAGKLEAAGKWRFYGRLMFRKYNLYSDGFVDIYQVQKF
ncbi:methyltransferase-like protein 27 isoform X2 [Physella acuta]|uniref:methyltransferase-like protein 27 isoform X2 n=1 Tax=Physella acuta TaxID=109671 RepID=UPI0027DB1EBF|nr:methyltransferase-like protein 27 isoform X2 [Physella acuta]